MSLPLTDPNAVVQALAEYDRLGSDGFKAAYGFDDARVYYLVVGGRHYPSKGIFGLAYQLESGSPVSYTDFSGGKPVAKRLRDLGFEVEEFREGPFNANSPIRLVPVETALVDAFQSPPRDQLTAVRRESQLVARYLDYLGRRASFSRHVIPTSSGVSLYTDLFDVEKGELFEAKSSSDRSSVRLAIGQLVDYSYWLEKDGLELSRRVILLPERPADDVLEMVLANGIDVEWEEGSSWSRQDARRSPSAQ